MAVWRWMEAAQCRRGEVGTEEAFVRYSSSFLYDSCMGLIVWIVNVFVCLYFVFDCLGWLAV